MLISLFFLTISCFTSAQQENVVSLQTEKQRHVFEPFIGTYRTSFLDNNVTAVIGVENNKFVFHKLMNGYLNTSFEFPIEIQAQERMYTRRHQTHLETIQFSFSRYHFSAIITQDTFYRRQVAQHTIEVSRDGSTMSHEFQYYLYRRKHWIFGPWVLDTTNHGRRYATERKDLYIKVSNQSIPKKALKQMAQEIFQERRAESLTREQKETLDIEHKINEALRTGEVISLQEYKNRCSVFFKK
jgi:hypothetical protein